MKTLFASCVNKYRYLNGNNLTGCVPDGQTFRAGLDPAFREEIRQAFVSVTDPEMLKAFRAESFIGAVDSDVDRVRGWVDAIRGANPDSVSPAK